MDTQLLWFKEFMPWFIAIGIIELVLKLIVMWKTGRRNQLAWFIVVGLINTAGILPIIYLIINRKKEAAG